MPQVTTLLGKVEENQKAVVPAEEVKEKRDAG